MFFDNYVIADKLHETEFVVFFYFAKQNKVILFGQATKGL